MPKPHANLENMIAGLELAGMTRTEIAQQCHMSRNTVCRLATGEAREPSFEKVRKIEVLHAQRVSGSPTPGPPLISRCDDQRALGVKL